ncbi:MAG TPA: oligopeptide/dipeptide ABC transporter ATP-binding protein, partial [Rubrivivax sp.]|nr:oligopeptide/dipeptide ABC transporter ATP-binding protein [Rubrivivax sp.]
TKALFAAPRHPYTARLMSSTPHKDSRLSTLQPVRGNLPDLRRSDLPPCRFAERCERVGDACRQALPALDASAAHAVACWFPEPQGAAHV